MMLRKNESIFTKLTYFKNTTLEKEWCFHPPIALVTQIMVFSGQACPPPNIEVKNHHQS